METEIEVDDIVVPRLGAARLSVRMEIEGDEVTSRTWAAVYEPASRGAERVHLYAGPDEESARIAFTGARLVLESIAIARARGKAAT